MQRLGFDLRHLIELPECLGRFLTACEPLNLFNCLSYEGFCLVSGKPSQL